MARPRGSTLVEPAQDLEPAKDYWIEHRSHFDGTEAADHDLEESRYEAHGYKGRELRESGQHEHGSPPMRIPFLPCGESSVTRRCGQEHQPVFEDESRPTE